MAVVSDSLSSTLGPRYRRLHELISSLARSPASCHPPPTCRVLTPSQLDTYSLVSFVPLDVSDEESVAQVLMVADNAIQCAPTQPPPPQPLTPRRPSGTERTRTCARAETEPATILPLSAQLAWHGTAGAPLAQQRSSAADCVEPPHKRRAWMGTLQQRDCHIQLLPGSGGCDG